MQENFCSATEVATAVKETADGGSTGTPKKAKIVVKELKELLSAMSLSCTGA